MERSHEEVLEILGRQQSVSPRFYEKRKFEESKRKRRLGRSIMDEVAESLGMVKVRGAVSGRVYYE